jgi:protein arginine kinase activator
MDWAEVGCYTKYEVFAMLCPKCNKNLATVRYAEVVDGKVTEVHLCAECLAQHQQMAAGDFQLSGAPPSPKRPAGGGDVAELKGVKATCSLCSTELKDVLKTGKVGCPVCYTSFTESVGTLLRSIHTALRHRGKGRQMDSARERVRVELQSKRALLRSALKTENYEEAAALRDEIRVLEEGLGSVARHSGGEA